MTQQGRQRKANLGALPEDHVLEASASHGTIGQSTNGPHPVIEGAEARMGEPPETVPALQRCSSGLLLLSQSCDFWGTVPELWMCRGPTHCCNWMKSTVDRSMGIDLCRQARSHGCYRPSPCHLMLVASAHRV